MKSRFHRRLCAVLALLLALTIAPVPSARAAETPKLIAFTFDDGPSAHTSRLLDGLEARGAAATFFMCGNNGGNGVNRYGSLIGRMLALGCEPANHSNGHPQFSKLTAAQMLSEVSSVESSIYQQAGAEYTVLVRIPYGENTTTIRKTVDRPMIRWSVDPQDWKYRDADVVYRNIMNAAYDGAIVLLHDLYPTSVDGALRAMDSLRAKGYEFVTVSELFRRRGLALEGGQVYSSAPNKGVTLPAYTVPEITVSEGGGAVRVMVGSRDPGLTFRYTTDGSAPSLKSPVYTGPLTILTDTHLRVAGFDAYAAHTPVAVRFVRAITATPQIRRWDSGLLTLGCATDGASIFYTTDGSDPRSGGTPYTGPFAPGAVTRAVALADGLPLSKPLELVKLSNGMIFCDVPASAYYLAALDNVAAHGLMGGVGDWRFAPQESTTRAAMVTTLFRHAGASAPKTAPAFVDVPADEWYADAVNWAAAEGIVNGVGDGAFAPSEPLTREQAAAILRRYAAHAGLAAREPHDVSEENYPGASPYAVEPLAWCAANGIPYRNADGSLTPVAPIERADLAMMLSALCRMTAQG